MAVFSYFAFAVGVLAYCFALLNMQTSAGEIASDFGNGAMLISAVVMLFRIHRLLVVRERIPRAPE